MEGPATSLFASLIYLKTRPDGRVCAVRRRIDPTLWEEHHA